MPTWVPGPWDNANVLRYTDIFINAHRVPGPWDSQLQWKLTDRNTVDKLHTALDAKQLFRQFKIKFILGIINNKTGNI